MVMPLHSSVKKYFNSDEKMKEHKYYFSFF